MFYLPITQTRTSDELTNSNDNCYDCLCYTSHLHGKRRVKIEIDATDN